MLIIAGAVITVGVGNLKTKNLTSMYTDLKSINDKVAIYYSQYGTLPLGEKFMGSYTFETVANPNDDPDMYYVVNVNKLQNLVLLNKLSWEENDVYIINTKTHTLYYPEGVELDGEIYYRLPGEYSVLQLDSGLEIEMQVDTAHATRVLTITIIGKDGTGIKTYTTPNGSTKTYSNGTNMIKETYAVDKNGVYTFTITNVNGETATQTITVTNIVETAVIPISTVEQLEKIGTGEIVQISGVPYDFEESSLYELQNDIEFTGDYSAIANKLKANNIRMTGGDNRIIVTKTDGKTEYYTEDSKYYIAVNKYGYVIDGLELFYDGIDNIGTGVHSLTTSVWKDLSGNNRDGTLSGVNYTDASGWIENGLRFDGNDDWVSICEMNYSNISLETVFTPTNVTKTSQYIVANLDSGGYSLGISAGQGYFSAYINGAYKDVNAYSVSNGVRYSVMGSFDGAYIKNRCNAQNYSIAHSGTIGFPGNSTRMALGVNPTGSSVDGGYFAGTIHSVRIYSKALTDDEAQTNYKADQKRYGV